MSTRFRLDFRFLEQKNTRGCSAVPPERIRADSTARSQRVGHPKRAFGFRNRTFAISSVELGGIYHLPCVNGAEMNHSDPTQLEETKVGRYEEQGMSGQFENRLNNL